MATPPGTNCRFGESRGNDPLASRFLWSRIDYRRSAARGVVAGRFQCLCPLEGERRSSAVFRGSVQSSFRGSFRGSVYDQNPLAGLSVQVDAVSRLLFVGPTRYRDDSW